MIFETHAHYDDAKFDTDREMLLAELPQRGISPVINAGSSIATTKTTLSLAQEYPFLYAAVGVHPSDVDDLNEDTYAWLRQQTTLQKTVAVGEIGLDYYWDKEPEIQAKQRYWFVRQLALAQQADLPVIIHSRDAAEDTMQISYYLTFLQNRGIHRRMTDDAVVFNAFEGEGGRRPPIRTEMKRLENFYEAPEEEQYFLRKHPGTYTPIHIDLLEELGTIGKAENERK